MSHSGVVVMDMMIGLPVSGKNLAKDMKVVAGMKNDT